MLGQPQGWAGGFSVTSLSLFHQGLPSLAELRMEGKSSTKWFMRNIAAEWVEAEAGVSVMGIVARPLFISPLLSNPVNYYT